MRRTVLEDDGPVGQTGGRRCQVMQALVAAIQAFGMQNPIDFGCHWPPRTIKGREGGLKRFGFGMLTQKAGPVTGSERGCFVQEEQFSPATPSHDSAANTTPLQFADQPGLAGPATVQKSARQWIVDDAPVPREHPTLGFGDDVAHGRDTVLQRHDQYRRSRAVRRPTRTFTAPAGR